MDPPFNWNRGAKYFAWGLLAVPQKTVEKIIMNVDNGLSGIIAVSAEQIAIALALFRTAVLDETTQEPILPITDRGICTALIEPNALQRGLGVIRIRFLNLMTAFIR